MKLKKLIFALVLVFLTIQFQSLVSQRAVAQEVPRFQTVGDRSIYGNATIPTINGPTTAQGSDYDYVGGTTYSYPENHVMLSGSFIPAANTTAYTLGIYPAQLPISPYTYDAQVILALYTNTILPNGDPAAGTFLAATDPFNFTVVNSWIDESLNASVPLTSGTRYWLMIEMNTLQIAPNTNTAWLYYSWNSPVEYYCNWYDWPRIPVTYCDGNYSYSTTVAYFYTRVGYVLQPPSQADLDSAINLGISWMNRHYAPIGSTGYYAIRDHSAVPIYIQRDDGYVRMAGDQQPGSQGYTFSGITSSSANGQIYEIDFETGTDVNLVTNDYNHDDLKFNITYTALSDTQVQVSITYLLYAPDDGHTWSVYLAGTLVFSGNQQGVTNTIQSPAGAYGWNSLRYVHRHSQQLAQSIYAATGDWQKAMQLQQLLSDKGFSTDIYDPMFFKGGSTTANSFPDNFGQWDRTWWDEYVYFNGTWANWFPQANGGVNAGYAYKSRILGASTQTQWQTGPGSILPYTPLYQLSRAMQLMNQNPYGFDRPTVQALINGVNWDGKGVEGSVSGPNYPLGCGPNPHPDSTCIFVGGTVPYSVPGYQEYNTAYFLAAATMFYYYTSNSTYKTYADQAAWVLLGAQVKNRLVHTVDYGLLDRPDLYGGFFTGYHSSDVTWKDTGTHGLLEILWGVEEQLGWFIRMGPESGLPVVVSGESTTLAIWALKVYEAYGLGLGWGTWYGWNKFASSTTDCTHAGTQCRAISLYEPADIRLYVAGGKGYYATATLRANINAATTITQIDLRHYLSGQLVGDSYGAKIEVAVQVFDSAGHSKYSNTRLLYQANAFQTVNVEAGRWDVWTGLNLSATSGWYIVVTYKVTTLGKSNQADSAYADFGQSDTPNFSPPVQYFIRVGYVQLNNPLTTPPLASGA